MIVELLLLVTVFIGWIYFRFRQRSNYWTKLGVKQPAENPFPMGNNTIVSAETTFNRKNAV